MPGFVHLHVHTEYSLLDGASPVPKLIGRAVEHGMPAIAMTDHGNMFGMVKFFKACKAAGVKPIIGCEVYVAPRRMTDKVHEFDKKQYHLTLLVTNEAGYLNLIKMVSDAYTEGFYYKPRVDRELLAAHSGGLIAMSGCLKGEPASRLLESDYDRARDAALWHLQTFGEGNYFLEIMDNGLEDQRKANQGLIRLSDELGIPLVATNDVHYVDPEDATVQDVLICVEQGATLDDAKRLKFDSQEFYLKTEAEMRASFADHPEAVDVTTAIAGRCNFELEFDRLHLPEFPVPDGKTAAAYLRELAMAGLERKYPGGLLLKGHIERAEFELDVIEKMDYPAYFLIVWDMIRFARSRGIPVGPGRGSAAGSIVSYALDITKIDPIKYDLLFERFLNPDRISMPDIDMDFCYERRGEVIDYCREKYGEDRVAMIITFGREKARNSIRDVGRVMGMPLPDVDRVAKLVPFVIPDKKVTLDTALEHVDELRQMYETDPQVKRLIDISRQIEGHARNVGIHAAGIVISKRPITEHIPIYKAPKDETAITQCEGVDLEEMGLLKMDLLGLRTLTVVADAVRYVEQRTGKSIDIDNVPLNDNPTYDLLARGETNGVFQFEGNTARNLIMRMKPTCLDDLIALNALNRPGPLGGGLVETYLENRNKKSSDVDNFHEDLEPVLRDTPGIILYQEQVMRIANVIGGFSLAKADMMRRAMGKKKQSIMDGLRDEFVRGALEQTTGGDNPQPKYDRALAVKMFDLMDKFSGYGFNKSHSAAYAFLAYQTAYLKANYPVEFMAALLTSIMSDTAKVSKYIQDCKDMKIEVCPPDINVGYDIFTPVGDKIYYGLAAVKNVGRGAIDAIIQEREKGGPFRTIFDVCRRVDLKAVSIKTLDALIRSGACDTLEGHRAQNMGILDEAMELGRRAQRDRDSGQTSLFGDTEDSAAILEPKLPDVEQFSTEQILQDEKDLLGLYLTVHPLDPYREWIKQTATAQAGELLEADDTAGRTVVLAGVVRAFREVTTRNGDLLGLADVEDYTGTVTCSISGNELKTYRRELREGNIVSVKGRVHVRTRTLRNMETITELRMYVSELDNRFGTANAPKIPPKRTVHFKIDSRRPNAGKLVRELEKLLAANRGQSRVLLHLDEQGRDRTILLRGSEARASSELLSIGRKFFGKENVWIITEKEQLN